MGRSCAANHNFRMTRHRHPRPAHPPLVGTPAPERPQDEPADSAGALKQAGEPPPIPPAPFQYDAFISYRRSDGEKFAERLRERLETYRLPKPFQTSPPHKLAIYLDRIYEKAEDDFFEKTIKPSLTSAENLIVVRTPAAVEPRADGKPTWMEREIGIFLKLPQRQNISVALARGTFDDHLPGDLRAVFPNIEIVDVRQLGSRWPRLSDDALLPFLATLHKIPARRMPELRREESRRRTARLTVLFSLAAVVTALLGVALFFALTSRARLQEALSRSDLERAGTLIESGRAAQALAHLASAVRLDPTNVPARSLLLDLTGRRSWPLAEVALEYERSAHLAALSPDGRWLVTVSADGAVRVRSTDDGRTAGPARLPASPASAIALSKDGHWLAIGSEDGTARVWEVATWRLRSGPLRHELFVNAIVFSADGERVVTGADDGMARVWDARNGQPLTPPLPHDLPVLFTAFAPDGKTVVTTSVDKTLRIWDAATGQPKRAVLRHSSWLYDASLSRDGRRMATSAADGKVLVWDLRTGTVAGTLSSPGQSIQSVLFSPDDEEILTASTDGMLQVWDARSLSPLGEPLWHGGSLASACYGSDGRIITASKDGLVRVLRRWTIPTRPRFLKHDSFVLAARFDRPGQRVVTASLDATARVWDARTGKPLGPPLRHAKSVNTAEISPDGSRVVTASDDGTARIWDAATGRALTPPLRHKDRVIAAEYSPDGSRIVTASNDMTARIWDAVTGHLLRTLKGHTERLNAAHFSPDGRRVLTASVDRSTRLWDTATGREATPPLRQAASVVSARFSGDGQWVGHRCGERDRAGVGCWHRPAGRRPAPA